MGFHSSVASHQSLRLFVGLAVVVSLSLLVLTQKRGLERVEGAPCVAGAERESPESFRSCEVRGNCLLHAWPDDELLRLAIALEDARFGPKPAGNSETGEPAADFGEEDQRCGDRRSWAVGEAGTARARACGLKVAFLFLTRGALPLGSLWNEFFRGHEGLYNVYVHMDPLHLAAHSSRREAGVFWGRTVPSQRSERGSPGLIAATRRLMANALLDDPNNEWFAMISDSCIPVRGFLHVYRTLSSTKKSFIGWASEDHKMLDRWRARGEEVMLPEVPLSDFRISAQFFILRRQHTVLVVNDTMYWTKFREPCLPRFRWKCFPEEHYFATLLSNHLDQNDTTMGPPTLTDWSISTACRRPAEPGHPREFCAVEISEDFLRQLQARDGGRYLFVRKFQPETLEGLMKLSHVLLHSNSVQ